MSVVTVPEVKQHLNISTADHDDELQGLIEAAEAAIAQVVGPLAPTTLTGSARGGGRTMVLPQAPVVSVTTVTPTDGVALTMGDLYVNAAAGVVEYVSGERFADVRHSVEYVAGRATLDADLLLAVKELVRHYWVTQRGSSARPGSRPPEGYSNTVPGAAYAMPFRVSELLAPHRTVSVA